MPNPRRRDDLHVEHLEGELCIYDGAVQQAHVLNDIAARVWERCDGQRGAGELAMELARDTDGLTLTAADAVVVEALTQLRGARLLVEAPGAEAAAPGLTRRALLALGVGAALVPLVQTIAVPSAAAQGSVPVRAVRAYITNALGNTVSVIDTATNTVTATVTVGTSPLALGEFVG